MQLRHAATLLEAGQGAQKVAAVAWDPSGAKLAIASADRVVHLYDEAGQRRDRFRTKPAEGNASGAYVITGLAFSPDGARLAVAQSDAIVFVYRLGAGWEEKKSICNKFAQSAAPTCAAWPVERPGDVCFGLADGKVKLGALKSNKTYTLYAHPDGAAVAALAAAPGGRALVSGHADGSLYVFTFPEQDGGTAGCIKLAQHSCPPTGVSWGDSIIATGSDCKVLFYDPVTGREQACFDHSVDPSARAFGCVAANPAGDAAVVGAYDRLYMFGRGGAKGAWQAAGVKQLKNVLPITALAWKPDGSQLVAGGLRGSVDAWDACIKRTRHKGKFELTYVSKAAVIVKTLATGARIVLKSVYGYEVAKVNVYQGRYIVGRTHATLLLGDLDTCRLSEVPWQGGGGERFYFESEQACLLYSGGELHVVEYGVNEAVASLRTEHASPYLLSVAIQEARGSLPASKRVAYLIDATTLRVVDFTAASEAAAAGAAGGGGGGAVLATAAHDARIDWLELNQRGSHVLYRDKARRLFLLDAATGERAPLLPHCAYAQWVPGSDCAVAQGRGELCVWYGVSAPDKPTVIAIKGDVVGIERAPGRTEVLVDEGLTQAAYALDEGLIDLGAALEFLDFERAVATLEALPPSAARGAQWRALGAAALKHEALAVAERAAAAVGDVSRASYLRKLIKLAEREQPPRDQQLQQAAGAAAANLPPAARAGLAVLAGEWPAAEGLLLAQGRVQEAVDAYKRAHMWDDAVRVADTAHHPGAEQLRAAHYKWLMSTGQEDLAGAVKEREGDVPAAIALYLKGSAPGRAAQAIIAHPGIAFDPALVAAVAAALAKAGLHERAGDLAAHLGRPADALAAYRKGRAYRKAVELARGAAPSQVVTLEEEWGDWLQDQRQADAAVAHFIEAGVATKAVEAALEARAFAKAAGIIEHLEPSKAAPYYKRIAQHYAASGSLSEAEGLWLKAGLPMAAVDMHLKAGNWEAAQKVAKGYLPPAELQRFNAQRAREAEAGGAWKEAERCYVAAGELEDAVQMYTKHKMWDALVQLVGKHKREALPAAHAAAAAALQEAGAWREAERHHVEAGDWQSALNMYRAQGAWEDALRVGKAHGGAAAVKQVAYSWAVSMSHDEAGPLLRRLGLGDAAVDAALEAGAFDHAFALAQVAARERIPAVHLAHAMYLEDNGRFGEAEGQFIAAGKPREAIDMYTHARDWAAAMRIAELHEPEALPDVIVAQANALAESGQLSAAESLFLRARRPDAALAAYKAAGQWDAALRVAEAYLPGRVAELHLEMASGMAAGAGGAAAAVARAQAFERGNDYARAIEAYLAPSGQGAGGAELDALQRCWEGALALAARHQRHRLADVAAAVAARLTAAGRPAAAVGALEAAGDLQGAVEAAVAAGLHDRARELAAASGDTGLISHADAARRRALVAGGDAEALAAAGDAGAAVDLLASRGDWERAHELAAQAGPELAAAAAARHAHTLLRQGDMHGAAAALAARPIGAEPQQLAVYRELALEVLGAAAAVRDAAAEEAVRGVLQRVLAALEVSAAARKQDAEDFSRMFWAAHFTACAARAASSGLRELAAQQLTAALRYAGIVPCDRAFYEAGMAWRAAGNASMAFVLLNRYLDIADAVDEGGAGAACLGDLEGADFLGADIPGDAPLPARHYCDERAREEARNYVLELSMDRRVEQALATRACAACGADTYAAGLTCAACGHRSEACVVSGYPVAPAERVAAKGGESAARGAWNAWVGAFGTDPLTGGPAAPLY